MIKKLILIIIVIYCFAGLFNVAESKKQRQVSFKAVFQEPTRTLPDSLNFHLRKIVHLPQDNSKTVFVKDVATLDLMDAGVKRRQYKLKVTTRRRKPLYPKHFDEEWLHGFGSDALYKHHSSARTNEEILVPDDASKENTLALAWMCYDAYAMQNSSSGWVDVGGNWNSSDGFGWDRDGVRGYVFTDDEDTVTIVAIKGTSTTYLGIGGGQTSKKDKFNDNMMFSCCCAKVDMMWRPICDCVDPSASHTCSSSCLRTAVNFTDSYYHMSQRLFKLVRAEHPNSAIWFTGHSLGGALASLLGLTYNLPAWGYEAPGDLLYAQRLGLLPSASVLALHSRKVQNLFHGSGVGYSAYSGWMDESLVRHWGNNGDPVFMGDCNGPTSSCYYAGYALESKCHVGKTCTYDIDAPHPSPPRTTSIPAPVPTGEAPEPPEDPWSDCDTTVSASWWNWRRWFGGHDNATEACPSNSVEALARLDIRNHRIEKAIEWYFEPWDGVPKCIFNKDCKDCEEWTFTS